MQKVELNCFANIHAGLREIRFYGAPLESSRAPPWNSRIRLVETMICIPARFFARVDGAMSNVRTRRDIAPS